MLAVFPGLYNICSFMAYGRIGLGEHEMLCKSVGVFREGSSKGHTCLSLSLVHKTWMLTPGSDLSFFFLRFKMFYFLFYFF